MSNGNEKFVITAVFDGSNAVKQAGQSANDINQAFGGRDLTGGLGGKFGALQDILGELGPAGAAAAGALATAFAGVSAAMDFADKINELREMSAAAGMMPQQFDATAKALTMTGWSAEEASDKLKDINERFGEFKTRGTGALADVLKDWNILASDLTSKDPIENLNVIIQKMQQQGATAEEIHFAMGEIVDDGQVLSQVLGDNLSQYQKTKDAALATSKATSENVENAKQFKQNSEELDKAWSNLSGTVGQVMLPYLNNAVTQATDFVNMLIDGINKIRQIKQEAADQANSTEAADARKSYAEGKGLRGGYINGTAGKQKGGYSYNTADPNAKPFVEDTSFSINLNDERSESQRVNRSNTQAERNAANAAAKNQKDRELESANARLKKLNEDIVIAKNLGQESTVNKIQKDIEKTKVDIDVLKGDTDKAVGDATKASIDARVDKVKGAGKEVKTLAQQIDSSVKQANAAYKEGMDVNQKLLETGKINLAEYARREKELNDRRIDAIGEANSKLTGEVYTSTKQREQLLIDWNNFYTEHIRREGEGLGQQLATMQLEHKKQEEELERHLKAQIDAKLMSEAEAQQMRDQLSANQTEEKANAINESLGIKPAEVEQAGQKYQTLFNKDGKMASMNAAYDNMETEENNKYAQEIQMAQGNYQELQRLKEEHEQKMSEISRQRNTSAMRLEQQYQQEKTQAINAGFTAAINLASAFGKKGAKIARALVLAQTIYNQWQAVSAGWAGIALAAASAPPPLNAPAIASAKLNFGLTVAGAAAAVAGAASQTVGQAHDGIDSVHKSGTWNLERGERVVDARTNRDLKNYLYQPNKQSGSVYSPTIHAGITIQGDVTGDVDEKMHEWLERNKESVTGVVNEQMGRLGYK